MRIAPHLAWAMYFGECFRITRFLLALLVCLAALGGALAQQSPQRQSAGQRLSDLLTYRASPWAPKWISLGRYEDADILRHALDSLNIKVGLDADRILNHPEFVLTRTKRDVALAVATAADLGLREEGASLSAIHTRARRLGFELCPAEVGPLLRLRYLSQPVGEWLHIAMKPFAVAPRSVLDFRLANDGARLMLIGASASADLVVSSRVKFVFVIPPSPDAVSSMPEDDARLESDRSP